MFSVYHMSNFPLRQEDDFNGARLKFAEAMNLLGSQPDLVYNIALCYYKQKAYGPALKQIADVIEKGVKEHPGPSVRPVHPVIMKPL